MIVVTMAACGDAAPTAATVRAPAIGAYDYVLRVPSVSGQTAVQYHGTLRVTFASDDSIAASVAVPTGTFVASGSTAPGLRASIRFGGWNVDAYYFWVEGVNGAPTVAHRVRASGSNVVCEATLLLQTGGATPTPVPSFCSLNYVGT